jgi:hypothetical protein
MNFNISSLLGSAVERRILRLCRRKRALILKGVVQYRKKKAFRLAAACACRHN